MGKIATIFDMSKSPMMKQYDAAKSKCGDALLFFRMGDFYELFHEDAKVAAQQLGLTLTSRDKSANAVPMAGFPHHQLDSYLGRLIQAGFRVAVCEQVEDPKTAKGLVKREIAQVVSPGTIADQALLDPAESNYLVAIAVDSDKKNDRSPNFGIAWAELSTGRFNTTSVGPHQLADLVARLGAKELLINEQELERIPIEDDQIMITKRPAWSFSVKMATDALKQQFAVATLDGFGLDQFSHSAVCAAGAIIQYLKETQQASLEHFNRILPFHQSEYVEIDSATWRSLEISRTIRSGSREGSLFGVIDRSVTPMGSRLLGDWLTNPLARSNEIIKRQDAVAEFVEDQRLRNGLREQLKKISDLQRLMARVATARTSPRDLSSVGKTLAAMPKIKASLAGRKCRWLIQMESDLDLCADLRSELENALIDPCPVQTKDGGFIKEGYDSELDELRTLASGGKQWIANYQREVCETTGIPSLKVGFNKVFGYYLEVTNTHKDKVPDEFIRKQTLKNAERYITPQLKEYEEKVLAADSQAEERELHLLNQLRELVRAHTTRLKSNAEIIATLDTVSGLAQLAVEQSYCRPVILDDETLEIIEGRHPVLDVVEPLGAFIPNDTFIQPEAWFLHLITGPNMAGKSTYIRQVALMTLMAQIGSFVPAQSAKIGTVDRIFARVGASDELSRGQSTFMVEMTETARILNTASKKSLVILDEIGRGTSTYDGVSLAWSIVEYLHDQLGCRTLFATHYHELTELEDSLEGVKNYNVSVQEWDEKIVFLHKIVEGSADKSYGIQVARLAGVPNWVNMRAEQILEKLESLNEVEQNRDAIKSSGEQTASATGEIQLTLFGPAHHPLVDKIKALDANRLTPMNALEILHEWKQELEDKAESSR